MRYALPCIILLIGLSIGRTHAQFPSFPDSNAYWLMSVWGQQGFVQHYGYHLRSNNHDTLLNGVLYNSLWAGSEGQGGSFAGGIRETGDSRIFYFHPNSSSEYLLYDLDPVLGETVEVWIGSPESPEADLVLMHITSIETLVNSNGTPYRVVGVINEIALNSGQGSDHFWIQGVGGSGGLFSTWGSDIAPLYTVYLDCMQANDTIWPNGSPGVCGFTGMNEVISRSFVIRPNPNNGRFTMEFRDPLLRESYYSVYDSLGRLLYQRPLPTGATLEEIDLSRFGSGTYVLRVTDPVGHRHERVVVE